MRAWLVGDSGCKSPQVILVHGHGWEVPATPWSSKYWISSFSIIWDPSGSPALSSPEILLELEILGLHPIYWMRNSGGGCNSFSQVFPVILRQARVWKLLGDDSLVPFVKGPMPPVQGWEGPSLEKVLGGGRDMRPNSSVQRVPPTCLPRTVSTRGNANAHLGYFSNYGPLSPDNVI